MEVKKVFALGNPILDITNTIHEESVSKYQLAYGQTVFANDTNIGIFDELESKPNVSYTPGGSVTNSIRVANVNYSLNILM